MTIATHKIANITIKILEADKRPVYIVTQDGSRVSHQAGYSSISLMDRETIEFYLDCLNKHADFNLVVDYILGCEKGHAHNMIERAKAYLAKETA